MDYRKQVARLTQAAAAVEADTFVAELLQDIVARPDELGQLARVFQRMVQEMNARAQLLQQQVQSLRIEIDEVKKMRQVAEITDTDYLRRLQDRARALRTRPGSAAN